MINMTGRTENNLFQSDHPFTDLLGISGYGNNPRRKRHR